MANLQWQICSGKCVRGYCACAESRDPWVGGQKQLHYNPRPRFAYSLYNFYWSPTTIKGLLLSSRPMLKPFSGGISSRRNGAAKWRFKKWGQKLRYTGFAIPKRHFLARNRVVWLILRQKRCARLGCSLSQEPKKVAESLCAEGRVITHAQNRNP